MDKRYQVFISSTFTDLVDERQAALRAVLELNHMPAGMELFPATDDSAWQLIRDVIDASDYYVLIIGGRYGSLDEAGIGFTEREYDYALEVGKPVIALLHENPDNLPREKTETDAAYWEKLKAFRQKVEKRHTRVLWSSAEELKAKLVLGLTSSLKRHPAVGWIRADQIPPGTTVSDVLKLRQRIDELEGELALQRNEPPPGSEVLKQGEDHFGVIVVIAARDPRDYTKGIRLRAEVLSTWNSIFAAAAPSLIGDAPDSVVRRVLKDYFIQAARTDHAGSGDLKGKRIDEISVDSADLDTCLVQLRALGLIEESRRKRSVNDKATYWTLTPYGDDQMVRLRALRRVPLTPRPRSGHTLEAEDSEGSADSK